MSRSRTAIPISTIASVTRTTQVTTARPDFQLELVVQYQDGRRQVWGSGPTWKGLDGGSAYPPAGSVSPGYYTAPVENLDAERYPSGFDTSAYRPAQQVGGDFFQLIAQPDGSALLVLGDVSGKGLKAAMTVALIVGTIRTVADTVDDPAEILSILNRRLHGRLKDGFVTCLTLRLNAEGDGVLANAGHPAPFLNREELNLPGALPLGLDFNADYESVPFHLEVGDRLTLYTDGLLEARNAAGDLFSFDRLRALIATQPNAKQATDAAVAFGQDDDITVLTLTRLAPGIASTTSLLAPDLVSSSA